MSHADALKYSGTGKNVLDKRSSHMIICGTFKKADETTVS
jgi:hypothetical protein